MKTFPLTRFWLSMLAGCLSLLVGCNAGNHSRLARTQLTISVSATDPVLFTASFDFGGLKGTVSTVASSIPTPVLERTIVGSGQMEISKQDASRQLTVDVYEGEDHPVHLVVPSGTKAARIVKRRSGWQVESL